MTEKKVFHDTDGNEKEFNENGITKGEVFYYNDDGKIITTCDGIFKDGVLRKGEIIEYNDYEKGNKGKGKRGTFKGYELNGKGEEILYYDNGKKRYVDKGKFKGGRLNGKGEKFSYYNKGNKAWEQRGKFKNGELRRKNFLGFKKYELISYDTDGSIRAKIKDGNGWIKSMDGNIIRIR